MSRSLLCALVVLGLLAADFVRYQHHGMGFVFGKSLSIHANGGLSLRVQEESK